MAKWKAFLRRNLLTIMTVIGVLSGAAVGIILKSTLGTFSPRDSMYLKFPGELFLRMLKSIIIPLLMSSIICAVGNLDLSLSRKIAIRSIVYYAITTVSAVIMGIFLVLTIRPGVGVQPASHASKEKGLQRRVLTSDTMLDLLRNVLPPNMIQACIQQSQTNLVPYEGFEGFEVNATTEELRRFTPVENYVSITNYLGLVAFSIVFGISLSQIGEQRKVLLDFFGVLSEAMMSITKWVIWLSPLGVFFLVAAQMVETDDFTGQVKRLGYYFCTVLLGLTLHGFGTISVIYFIAVRRLPFKVIAELSQVLATAFSTASSSATMPITIETLDRMGLDPRVTRFVIPVGSTINMDGTALYEAVAAIFIAQLKNIDFTFGKTVAVCVTATAASVGAAGIPQAGLVTMVMVLDTVGLPAEDVINILAVDWFLDRCRTTINVMCDCIGARLIDILSKGELDKHPMETDRLTADPQELVEMAKDVHS